MAVAVPLFGVWNALAGARSFYSLAVVPFAQVAEFCWKILGLLPDLFRQPENLSGVVGIAVEGSQMIAEGRFVGLALSLSISLAMPVGTRQRYWALMNERPLRRRR